MPNFLKVMLWNANGLLKHQKELEFILDSQKVDVCLIAETHFTKESSIKIKNYNVYHTIHPSNRARGGSAIIIKRNLKHHEDQKTSTDEFHVTTVKIYAKTEISISAVYSPPRHTIKCAQYIELINSHKNRFIMGGDFNAKHTHWGSRLSTTKGRELYDALKKTGSIAISTSSPTYWPTDPHKTPDLIDFFIAKKVSTAYVNIENGMDMSSDHSPIYLTLHENVTTIQHPFKLTNHLTDWDYFKHILEGLDDHLPIINTKDQLDDEVLRLTNNIQRAAWQSTPTIRKTISGHKYTKEIKEMVLKKRKIRRRWHQTRSPLDKAQLNKITKKLSDEIKAYKNSSFTKYLQELTNERKTNYSLWKCTKKLKQPLSQNAPIKIHGNKWAKTNKQKADTFANYLEETFTPYGSVMADDMEHDGDSNAINEIPPASQDEIIEEISYLKIKKSPGYDLITAEILKQLPNNIIAILTNIVNTTFKLKYFPIYWKTAEVVMFNKPGKDTHDVTSYRPISLLPILSKMVEKLLIKRINIIIENKKIIPTHQFGFRTKHSTIDQVHRIVRIIENAFEERKTCSAVFLDISKAFDKVCHYGLQKKINALLPKQYFIILHSYLSDRYFRVKQEDSYSCLKPIKAGVPQGSVLGPLLYLLFTCDLPCNSSCVTATFADDTAILSIGNTENTSTSQLQLAINEIYDWTNKWHIKLNECKSVHINFTQNKIKYVPIYLNGRQVPYSNTAKYLGMTLDAKLRWNAHVKKKKKEMELKYRNMYWLMGKESALSTNNKIIVYKQILKPVWSYGAQLWGCSSQSNIQSIQRLQNKIIKCAVGAPWYIRSSDLERDLNIDSVADTIKKIAKAHDERLKTHVNTEASILVNPANWRRRLKRKKPKDLMY